MPTAAEAIAAPAAVAAPAAPAAAPAANEPFWNSWGDADKDVKDWAQNKNFPDVRTLARSALGYEKMIGADRAGRTVVLPADEYDKEGKLVKADDAGRKAFYAKIGVPETADKYELPTGENNPYPQFTGYMKDVFLQAGVPARQAKEIAQGYEKAYQRMETEMRADEDRKSAADLAELERSWGANYQERVALAQRGSAYLSEQVGGLTELQQRGLEQILGTSKYMAFMWKVGAGNQEARFAGSESGKGNQFGTSASDAQSRLDALTADRAAGKISDHNWREVMKSGGEFEQLQNKIMAGFAASQK